MDYNRQYALGELFCGAGGLALGASQATYGDDDIAFYHLWANDNDYDSCQTFIHNIECQNVYCKDIQCLRFDTLDTVDGLCFGFPCNDYSVVGERYGRYGTYGGLYKYALRCLENKHPLFFLAENVTGLASSGDDFEVILSGLEKAGYNVFGHEYKFEQYGVPQCRHRIIITGFRTDLGINVFSPAEPITRYRPITCKDVIGNVPHDASNHEITRHSAKTVERLSYIKPGENAFTANIPKRLQLNMKSNAKISQIYRRIQADKPSYTVTAAGGGGTEMYHWEENRALTNRERARLQTFPDDFYFIGGKTSVRKQIGMAVPPAAARLIFEHILKTLVDRNIKSRVGNYGR